MKNLFTRITFGTLTALAAVSILSAPALADKDPTKKCGVVSEGIDPKKTYTAGTDCNADGSGGKPKCDDVTKAGGKVVQPVK